MQRSLIVNKTPFFYGWVILAVGTLGVVMTSPAQTYTISIFTEYFIRDLHVSRSLVSILYAMGTLMGSLALPFIGREIDRRGSRGTVVVIAVAFGLACLYMGAVRGPFMLAIGFIAIRMLGQGGLGLVSQNVINQWWVNRRGTVMGLSGLFGSLLGLGGFPPLVNWLIRHYGWQMTYTLLGVLLLFGLAPLGYLFFRERPEVYGLVPDGNGYAFGQGQAGRQRAEAVWTRAQALRSPTFWIVALGTAAVAMLSTGLFFHMVSIFEDNGLSAAVAAEIYLPIAATTALVTLSSGPLVDRIPLHYAQAASLFLLALAMLMARHLPNMALTLLYGVALGASVGLFRTVATVAWAHYFGRQHLGSISGAGSMVLVIGSALGPIPFAIAHDLLGNYKLALSLLAVAPLALGVATLLMPRLMGSRAVAVTAMGDQ